jgi:hypothetical protein
MGEGVDAIQRAHHATAQPWIAWCVSSTWIGCRCRSREKGFMRKADEDKWTLDVVVKAAHPQHNRSVRRQQVSGCI